MGNVTNSFLYDYLCTFAGVLNIALSLFHDNDLLKGHSLCKSLMLITTLPLISDVILKQQMT